MSVRAASAERATCNAGVVDEGAFRTSSREDLEAFDQLPRPIRLALVEQPLNLAAEPLLRAWASPRYRPDLDESMPRAAHFLEVLSTFRAGGCA